MLPSQAWKKQPATLSAGSWGIIGRATGLHRGNGLKDALRKQPYPAFFAPVPEQQ
jgi:hypothetical protein